MQDDDNVDDRRFARFEKLAVRDDRLDGGLRFAGNKTPREIPSAEA